jgi:hypothetical protein
LPPAPARLSTITVWFHASVSFCASTRQTMSMLLPAPIGTTMRTGFVG